MTLFLKIISIVIFVATIVVIFINERIVDKDTKFKFRYSLLAILLAIALFTLSCSIVIIPTGYTGVRVTFGQIDASTVRNGFNWKLPFVQSIKQVNNKQQDITFDGQVWSETTERTAIYYDKITVTYQINPEKSAWIYANVANYENALVNQNIVSSAIKSSSKVLPDSDATNRSIIEPLVMSNLQSSLNEKYGENVVYINKVTINNADFEESYNQAISAKQKAQLEAEQQAIENKRAIEKAEADATVKKTNAEAEAKAKVIAAEAEAKANQLLEKSLTDQILREMWVEKWDGQLPRYVSGNDSSVMFGIDTNNDNEN